MLREMRIDVSLVNCAPVHCSNKSKDISGGLSDVVRLSRHSNVNLLPMLGFFVKREAALLRHVNCGTAFSPL